MPGILINVTDEEFDLLAVLAADMNDEQGHPYIVHPGQFPTRPMTRTALTLQIVRDYLNKVLPEAYVQ